MQKINLQAEVEDQFSAELKSELNELPGFVDWKGKPARKDRHGGKRSTLSIYVMTGADSLAFVGVMINLVTYFSAFMNMEIAKAATTLTNFVGTTFLLALVGGIISDCWFTRFKTLVFSDLIQTAGYVVLLIQAHYSSLRPPHCNLADATVVCVKVSGAKSGMLFVGLYLVAIGSGGTKATVAPFGADQFDDRDPDEKGNVSHYFNMFFFSVTVGATLGVTVLVWVQDNRGWDAGFGITAGVILFGMVCILLRCNTYRNRIPQSSPLTRILQVFVVAIKNRKLKTPENPNDIFKLDEEDADLHTERLLHTNQFKFLDKAAVETNVNKGKNSWYLCSVTQVEETKIIVRMMPIFASTVLLSTCLAQLQTFTVSQGVTMDRSMGKHFKIPAASLPVIPLIFLNLVTPIYDRYFVPLISKFTGHESGITHLQRIGIGLVLSVISMALAAIVEVKRKHLAIEKGMVDSIPLIMPPIPMSVFWLGFPYFVFGIADLFTYVGMLEFFYSEAPVTMRSFATAFAYASLSLGYFLSSVFVNIVNAATRNMTESHGWLGGNNLNRNHLDLFYWFLAILSVLNFINYLFWSRWYKRKPVVPYEPCTRQSENET
ncbi:hypothetical protein SUGI_0637380 [Cryptomeria japonica]|uniref:protein NRT1/ PTR FAMILY 4.5-like n=1 Tax=Cryptomeria japonica TaxID=3369 RepID=UPI002414A033|nr:protein NRT1/ PTR FAMILY 4.5-like [Cryptomeria japonica]GLJ31706.1 hypothetical protein SUGI_0637380 [Cryptomeria japonica]